MQSDNSMWLDQLPTDTLGNYVASLQSQLSATQIEQIDQQLKTNPQQLQQLLHVLLCSQFAQNQLLRQAPIFCELLASGTLERSLREDELSQQFTTFCGENPAEFDKFLRLQRNLAMLRIIWRDFNRSADFNETTDDLSALARAAINSAHQFHYRALIKKYGEPCNSEGEIQPFIVLGMGKLGACELNLSSDIDLIFTYPEKGDTNTATNAISNQEFFSLLGKKLIHSLDAVSVDGFVFRVDMRLRPYGDSGPLVCSYAALEDYYLTQGREWERYAMVKAAIVSFAIAEKHRQPLMKLLRSFSYRKYIDFSVIDALRNLKKMIEQEVIRRKLQDDIKLGAGGIREIEFIVQVFQLIRGGRDTALQDNRLLVVLPKLAELNCLPPATVNELTAAYLFLRNTEHAIQGFNDQQTQRLPTRDIERLALCRVMGFAHWNAFYTALNSHRERVQKVFSDVIAAPNEDDSSSHDEDKWAPLWNQGLEKHEALEQLAAAGHENPELSLGLLQDLHNWTRTSAMQASSRERLDNFMPLFLARLSQGSKATETFNRTSKLLKAITRRSAYLLLLNENPAALNQLLTLSEASPWIADQLALHPALLDELLDPSTLYKPPEKQELRSDLQRFVARIADEDLEAHMEALRYFRSSHALRVAASEISGVLPLMKVSDYLTFIAEVILEYSLQYSWKEMVRKHGYPDGIERDSPKFAILGYGKLGGIELSHGSDLDLVFIYQADANGSTGGNPQAQRSLDNQTFFTRLGQKIIHFINTKMTSGALYEIDMRLRPSGNSGMLVSSINSFEKYQNESAWTWEHQALVRARVICGDAELTSQVEAIRHQVLTKQRELANLRRDVIAMREKMREHLGSPKGQSEAFDIKQDQGGIVDIEFLVQYGVLAWAHTHPGLAIFTDNIRILESFADSNLLTAQEVSQLTEAYKAFRAAGHRLTLQQQPNRVDASEFINQRQAVRKIWQHYLSDDPT